MVSSRMATLNELNTIYGVSDLYDLLEIVMIDAHNRTVSMGNRDK